ncbi:MAG TPA: AsmA-like C-terminal region-containing protein, partial [Puia sp.]|nr:AsmA-like C-terminal region-containing protein [Puia sp.]
GTSDLSIKGEVQNLFSLITKNGDKPEFSSEINSNKLDLNDFMPFLKKTSIKTTKAKSKTVFVNTISHVMKGLAECNVHVRLKAKQLVFKKFFANNLTASVALNNNQIDLKNVSLENSGGLLTLSAKMKNFGTSDTIIMRTKMMNMDINRVMIAFDNFGQSGITHDNLKGKLTADIILQGNITEKASLYPNSIRGTIDFSIRNGELIQYEPVQKISEVAFKNRDFSNIQFAELKDKFDVDGTEIRMNRMEVHSTVLTMFVEGIYDFKKGTDMSIQIPLSNLKNKSPDENLKNQGVNSKTGLSVRLRAKTGDDGKLKVTWDPFKKALKKESKKAK